MKVKIHRGTHQIGGCITEISTQTTKIIIDMGEELPNKNKAPHNIEIDGITKGIKDCNAVFFTHYHGDHLGLYKNILPDIPIYIGEAAKEIFLKLSERIDKEAVPIVQEFITFKALDKIRVGNIKITPLLIDHSAYDAYMFLIESDNKRILHTGDFREHGFRGKKLIKMLEKYVGKVDTLIIEGTMLSREGTVISEDEIMKQAKVLMNNENKKYVFVLCSSTNIDRIALFYNSNPRGRYFICDEYQKSILDVVSKFGSNKSNFYNFKYALTYGKNLEDKLRTKGFCMLVRQNDFFKNIIEKYEKEDFLFVYSMWGGYLDRDDTKNDGLVEFLKDINYVKLHTSGHATKETIIRVCNAVKPKSGIIPIHSENSKKLLDTDLNYPVHILNDGETIEIK
ncbi:MBL fold metallo-hydrolase [Sedimentibacter sp. MB31-C6]|uniref:MBL fold metallo-hydrolase n=1 Tax=Sedimentibacter sp. MB31-C6 TaxID=3109366 RepID=UPI002DDD5D71|nr:MBL fold metallo-hydrolase [Sedimentibacter sp. MB36-C1]WSI04808.1 MBL fold metallo-hydrolase [Sedimentibacter sp. MB36-C1]